MDQVIRVHTKAANTGKIGDGKIFVTELQQAIPDSYRRNRRRSAFKLLSRLTPTQKTFFIKTELVRRVFMETTAFSLQYAMDTLFSYVRSAWSLWMAAGLHA